MIGRRELIAGGVAVVGGLVSSSAQACSLTYYPRTPFNDQVCRASLVAWVALLNEETGSPSESLISKIDDLDVEVGDNILEEILSEAELADADRGYTLYTRFRVSDGKLDRAPIKLKEVNRIRKLRNRASYQFTLVRQSYHAADEEGCNGLFTHDELWSADQTSYLATFWNNRLQAVKLFPEWYLEEADG